MRIILGYHIGKILGEYGDNFTNGFNALCLSSFEQTGALVTAECLESLIPLTHVALFKALFHFE